MLDLKSTLLQKITEESSLFNYFFMPFLFPKITWKEILVLEMTIYQTMLNTYTAKPHQSGCTSDCVALEENSICFRNLPLCITTQLNEMFGKFSGPVTFAHH